MPELPEVETVKLGLVRLLTGRTIKSYSFDWPKSFPNQPVKTDRFLISAEVKSINRRGKALIIELSTDYSLVIHLKMTGQLVFRSKTESFGAGHPNDSLVGELPNQSTRVIIEFLDGSRLYFNDQRKFGYMKLVPSNEVSSLPFFVRLGPEPLEPGFDGRTLQDRLLRRSNTSIKAALLDQSVIAGVGNIYADEALWGAKIHPATLVKNLSSDKIGLLASEIVYVLKLAIEKGGSTDKNYVSAEGKAGSYLSFARVFRREGLPCPRCNTIIVKTRVAGRGTHYCPNCQVI